LEQYLLAAKIDTSFLSSRAETTSVTLGVNNLLDRDPPAIYGSVFGDYDPTAYDFKGRLFYARLSQQFRARVKRALRCDIFGCDAALCGDTRAYITRAVVVQNCESIEIQC
jgi:hypothetical protein